MSGARNAFRIAGSAALAVALLMASDAGLVAKPLADPCTGKSDRLASAAPELVSGGASHENFVTVARHIGASTTVLERVAVAH